MAGPLALVGGDELKAGNEQQDELLARAAGSGPAFVLATAAARSRPGLAVANAKRWFARWRLAIEELPVLRRSDARSREIAARASTGRFFYLVGGDPGLVVEVLRDTPLWEAIVAAWKDGAALGGSSAGAMAMGEWTLIRGGRWPDHRTRRYKEALGIVARTTVLPHFDTFGHTWVESARAAAPSADVVLAGIDERTAAVWRAGSWRVYGPGSVTVIAGGSERTFHPGDELMGLPRPVEA